MVCGCHVARSKHLPATGACRRCPATTWPRPQRTLAKCGTPDLFPPAIKSGRGFEADCGAAYHAALADVPMRWRYADRLPRHWQALGTRTSLFGQGARGATNPG
jgi:hypothetical protein